MPKSPSGSRGSITVEAAVIVPLTFLCVLAVIYMGILLYHSSFLHSVVSCAAQRAASAWDSSACEDPESGITDRNADATGLYWSLFGGSNEKMKSLTEQYISSQLERKGFLEEISRDIDIRIINNIFSRKLVVKVDCCYRNPAANFLGIFGMKDSFKVSAEYVSKLNNAPDFIRNTDFICDIEKELEDKYPGLKNAADEIRGVFSDIKQNIEGVFE